MSDTDRETNFYQVQNAPVDGVPPGDVIELHESTAVAFADNLVEIDADSRDDAESEAEANPTPGQRTGTSPGAPDLDVEAGTYVVQDTPINDAEPGDVVELPPDVARAFADNLEVADDSASSEAEDVVEERAESDETPGAETEAADGPENEATDDDSAEGGDGGGGDSESGFRTDDGEFDAEAFVSRTPQQDIRADLESGQYDDHLDAIVDAEEAHKDRQGVHEAVEDRRDAS